jgi:hypothetical protein
MRLLLMRSLARAHTRMDTRTVLNNCIKEPHSHLAVFVIEREGLARLDFIQNMEYKFVELLSCNFIASPEDVIRAHICFRYNTLKSRLALVQARLQDIESLIKVAPLLARTSLCAPTPRPSGPFAVACPLPCARGTSVCLTAPAPHLDPWRVLQVKNPSLLLQLSKAPASRHGLK